MLGHMVMKYVSHLQINHEIIEQRWPSNEFTESIKNSNSDFLINCIACIPQKYSTWNLYKETNIDLPIFLIKNFNGKIINPTSDCEFSGNIKLGKFYEKNHMKDVTDDYGISKSHTTNILLNYNNVKQIRSSLIGPEIKGKVCLMEWFFRQNKDIHGYNNHYWNGITTLEWTKQCLKLIENWDRSDNLIQLGTTPITKYDLLCFLNKIFECKKNIISISTEFINRSLKSDYLIKNIEDQLIELKQFYYENKFHSAE